MRVASMLVGLGLAVTVTAAAQAKEPRISDVEYLQASRCKGLAASPAGGQIDASRLDALLKRQSQARPDAILQKGEEVMRAARRQGRDADRSTRLAAELSGACAAFLTGDIAAAQPARAPAS